MSNVPKLVDPRSTADTERTLIVFDAQGRKARTYRGWSERTGGELTSEATVTSGDRSQGDFIIGGAGGVRGDITLSTMFNRDDEVNQVTFLEQSLGNKVEYISQPLDRGGQPVGKAYKDTGVLTGVTRPEEGPRTSQDAAKVSVTIKVVSA